MKVTLKNLAELIADVETASIIDEKDVELTDKLTDLGLDSLDVVEIVMEIEVKFDVLIPDDVYEAANTIEDLLNILNKDLTD